MQKLSLEALANLFVRELRENNWITDGYSVSQGIPAHKSYNPGSSAFTIIGRATVSPSMWVVNGEEFLGLDLGYERRRLYSWQLKQLCNTWAKEALVCQRCKRDWINGYRESFKMHNRKYEHAASCTLHAVIFGTLPVFTKNGDVQTNLEQARIAAGMARKSVKM